ncbi:unnamed protein product [Auanema sp. JU1783]|nr:unnamed protein product [Auanema sp. JU1783]
MNDKTSRTRNKNNLLALVYDKKYPNLKVIHKCRSYLATMGVPANNGEHYLWPEEAIFLLEMCSAVIYCSGKPLTLLEGYRILEEKKVPHFKYLIYASLKKAGFVITRPKKKNDVWKKSQTPNKHSCNSGEKPKEACSLYDSFPSLSKNGLHIPLLNSSNKYIPFTADFKTPDNSVLQITRDADRLAPCRPSYKPSFEKINTARNWTEFRILREEMLKSKKKCFMRSSETTMISNDNIDFEIHPSTYSFHSMQEPLHRVVCFDVVNGEIDIHKLCSNYKNAGVIVAIHQHGKINFIRSSGEEIKMFSQFIQESRCITDVDMTESESNQLIG